ncbi:hypothetical protein ACJ73_07208 [Blastomyces percursus]|uniref:Uncharacterized protein n=1 Tax=Blastomyces percursus TaxID=1658174 RepID=A0A1J9R086_9EURO|nr:hypothetical protein ACJ73_07208 [Blastomyces percursus]
MEVALTDITEETKSLTLSNMDPALKRIFKRLDVYSINSFLNGLLDSTAVRALQPCGPFDPVVVSSDPKAPRLSGPDMLVL